MVNTTKQKHSNRIVTNKLLTILTIVAALIIVAVIVITNQTSTVNPKPETPTLPPIVQQQTKQQQAADSTNNFMKIVIQNLTTQIGEENVNNLVLTPQTLNEDVNGQPATVALIGLSNIPQNFEWKPNQQHVLDTLMQQNNETTQWETLVSDETTFTDNPNIFGATKIWDANENPKNVAIVEVTYMANLTATTGADKEIFISSTVY